MEYDAKTKFIANAWFDFRESTLENIQDHIFKIMWVLSDKYGGECVKFVTHGEWVTMGEGERRLVITCEGIEVYEALIPRDNTSPRLRMNKGLRPLVRHFLAENNG